MTRSLDSSQRLYTASCFNFLACRFLVSSETVATCISLCLLLHSLNHKIASCLKSEACCENDVEIIQALRSRLQFKNEFHSLMVPLFRNGADTNTIDTYGNTVLHNLALCMALSPDRTASLVKVRLQLNRHNEYLRAASLRTQLCIGFIHQNSCVICDADFLR